MAPKRAIRKQQDTSRPAAKIVAAKATLDPVAQLNPISDDFDAAAAQCVQDADLDAVHRVRTGSRRLQATLEAMLREAAANGLGQLEQPARAMLRPLKQIRRAAGPVRDLDVHRKLLENWIGKRAPKQDDENELPTDAGALHTQAAQLDTWLKGERKQLAHGMQRQIRKRLQGLPERRSAFSAAIGHLLSQSGQRTPRTPDAVALEDFVRAADAMPQLDAENLHDFRKATKKARYVAESGAQGQRYSTVAKALKRIQDAIGEWHDWLCLAEEARTALGQDAPELTAALEREVERHFTAAMETTLSMRGRLLGEWMAINQPPGKRPPAAVAISNVRAAGFPSGFSVVKIK
jgi:CHAD domain-containing protein